MKLRILAVLAGSALLAPVASSAKDTIVVRPGMAIETVAPDLVNSQQCTLGFLFEAGSRRYATTAGHCPAGTGLSNVETVFSNDEGPVVHLQLEAIGLGLGWRGPLIGRTVYMGRKNLWYGDDMPSEMPFMDVAVIQLGDEIAVEPAVCWFGGPTGIDEAKAAEPFDAHLYGAAMNPPIGSERLVTNQSVFPGRSGPAAVDLDLVLGGPPIGQGDSGGPIIDDQGRAIALVTDFGFHYRIAPAIERAERMLGFQLQELRAPVEDVAPFGKDESCVP